MRLFLHLLIASRGKKVNPLYASRTQDSGLKIHHFVNGISTCFQYAETDLACFLGSKTISPRHFSVQKMRRMWNPFLRIFKPDNPISLYHSSQKVNSRV